MIIVINFICILIVVTLYLLGLKSLAFLLFVVFFIVIFSIGIGFSLNFLLNYLQKDYKKNNISFKNNNLIILLCNGVQNINETLEPSFLSYSRIFRAVDAYNLCLKNNANCKIIVSGYESDTYLESLLKVGVDKKDILIENKSRNTFENAKFTKEIINNNKFDNIILVSSSIHLKRAELYFNHFKINVNPCRGDYFQAKKGYIPKAYNFALMDFVIHEYMGIIRYRIDNLLGVNKN